MYIDNAVMQLINPRQFDVMASGNLFGTYQMAAQLVGSVCYLQRH